MGHGSLLIAVCIALSLLSHGASAQPGDGRNVDPADRATARDLGREAINLYRAGKYPDALDRMSRAHSLVNLTTTGLWRARCLEKLGRLVEASEQLREVKKMTLGDDAKPVHRSAQTDAAKDLAAIEPRIPRIAIRLEADVPDDTRVAIDNKPLDDVVLGVLRPIDPGRHEISVKGGGMTASATIELAEGEQLELPVRIEDRDDRRSLGIGRDTSGLSPAGIVGAVAIGVGVVGLTIGAIFGGVAIGTKGDLETACPDMGCSPAFHDDIDAFETQRTVSTAMFIAGGVITAIGLTLVITDVTTGGGDTARVELTPLSLRGTF